MLAAAIAEGGDDADQRLARLEFTATERAVLRGGGTGARDRRRPRSPRSAPSELARALRDLPVEAVALAGAVSPARPTGDPGAPGAAADPVRRWLDDLRHVGLQIDGADLLAAGVPRGPHLGRRLGPRSTCASTARSATIAARSSLRRSAAS